LTGVVTAPIRRWRAGGHAHVVEQFWALKDVSFEVQSGEVVGIIGRNGAGKSTLLKILSRITKPTCGHVILRGRVGSLLEVGTGFHPELTGRENIYMNGSILGMSRREIARKFDEIVDFAGIEEFLDTPVKRYSSGMYVRLAFAVAAHLEPEILIIDEVLAVGDAEFQKRCLGRLHDLGQHGRTILYVSHHLPSLATLCDRAIWLNRGQIMDEGPANRVISSYLADSAASATNSHRVDLTTRGNRRSGSVPILTEISMSNPDTGPCTSIPMGDSLEVELSFSHNVPLKDIKLGLGIDDSSGRRLITYHSDFQHTTPLCESASRGTGRIATEPLPLLPGTYYLSPGIASASGLTDVIDQALAFEVVAVDLFGTGRLPNAQQGAFLLPAKYECIAADQPL
jgi:lipopolysaccharide transport system ATP-binding protein